MPKTIVIDRLDLIELRLVRDPADPGKRLQVFARYKLISAGNVVQTQYREITKDVSYSRQVNAASLVNEMTADLAAAELS